MTRYSVSIREPNPSAFEIGAVYWADVVEASSPTEARGLAIARFLKPLDVAALPAHEQDIGRRLEEASARKRATFQAGGCEVVVRKSRGRA